MVQNAAGSDWDGPGLAALLHDQAASARLLAACEALVTRRHGAGIAFDFEELPRSAQGDYLRFLDAANRRFGTHGWIVTAAVPVGDPDWNLAAYARVTDRLFLCGDLISSWEHRRVEAGQGNRVLQHDQNLPHAVHRCSCGGFPPDAAR